MSLSHRLSVTRSNDSVLGPIEEKKNFPDSVTMFRIHHA